MPALSKQMLTPLEGLNHLTSKRSNLNVALPKKTNGLYPSLKLQRPTLSQPRSRVTRAALSQALHLTRRRAFTTYCSSTNATSTTTRHRDTLTMLTNPPSADMPTPRAYQALLPQQGWQQTWLRELLQSDGTESPIGGLRNHMFPALKQT